MSRLGFRAIAHLWLGLMAAVPHHALAEQTVRKAVAVERGSTAREVATQAELSTIREKLRAGWANLDAIERERRQLDAYNQHLEVAVAALAQRRQALDAELASLEQTRAGLVPLMLSMVEGLRAIASAGPFHAEARAEAVGEIERLLIAPGKSLAERYRGVLEGYMGELEYARTLDTYRASLVVEGAPREVDVVRIGRVGVYYVTSDAGLTGYWDGAAGRWQPLPAGAFGAGLRRAAKIAADRTAPDLITLPFPGLASPGSTSGHESQ